MKILRVTQHPLIKTAGILLVLYFALFYNKENPDSLGNRLSSKNIKKSLSLAAQKKDFISTNLRMAKEMERKRSKIIYKNVEIGQEGEAINCASNAKISYGIFNEKGRQLKFVEEKQINIGVDSDSILEKSIIGMKKLGIKTIKISKGSSFNDKNLEDISKLSQSSDITIRLTLLSFEKDALIPIECQ